MGAISILFSVAQYHIKDRMISHCCFNPYFHCWVILVRHGGAAHNRFLHAAEVDCIGYRKRRPPKRSLSLLPHSSSIIDMQLSLEKAARLSVDVSDKYFSWQTGHLTLSTTLVWGYRGYTCVHIRQCIYMCMRLCIHVYAFFLNKCLPHSCTH